MGHGIGMDDLHTRMVRVTEDLRVIQRELNCAAELGDKMRQANASKTVDDGKVSTSFLDQLTHADEALLLRYMAEAKERKPN